MGATPERQIGCNWDSNGRVRPAPLAWVGACMLPLQSALSVLFRASLLAGSLETSLFRKVSVFQGLSGCQAPIFFFLLQSIKAHFSFLQIPGGKVSDAKSNQSICRAPSIVT